MPPKRSAPTSTSDSLIDHSKPEQKQRRQLSKKTTDATVDKILKDNFKGHSQFEIDGLMCQGMTLRQRLVADRRIHNEDARSRPMGGPYYKELKAMYTSSDAPARMLKVSDETLPVSDALVAALVALKGVKKIRGLCRTSSRQPPASTRPSWLASFASHWTCTRTAAPTRCTASSTS